MKKLLWIMCAMLVGMSAYASETNDTIINKSLDEFTVTSFYRSSTPILGSTLNSQSLISANYGQEPSWLLASMPSIFAFSDNGTDFGYGYFRIRGLDQTRINVTLDGMPWNEAEDFGCYFANSPDILADAGSVEVGRGTSTYNPGTASYGGSVNINSVDLKKNTESYAMFGAVVLRHLRHLSILIQALLVSGLCMYVQQCQKLMVIVSIVPINLSHLALSLAISLMIRVQLTCCQSLDITRTDRDILVAQWRSLQRIVR